MRTLALLRVFVGLVAAVSLMSMMVSAAPTSRLPKLSSASSSLSLLNYTINVVPVGNGIEWQVTLTVRGNASGGTEFEIPSKWAGRDDFLSGIKDFKVSGDGVVAPEFSPANLTNDDAVKIYRVSHQPDAKLTINYRVVRIGNAYPDKQGEAYSPVLQSSYFHVIGEGAWVVPRPPRLKLAQIPEHPQRDPKRQIDLQWELPKDWAIANSFGANQRRQHITTTASAFRQGLYLGGDFRIAKFTVKNAPVYVALRGEWGFFDENFSDLARKIVDAERSFWPDHNYPFFLISAIPLGQASTTPNLGGTGLTNAIALFLAPRTQLKEQRHLLAHELWHNWNPGKMGELAEPERLLYWWSEGFTDFYTYRMLLKNGLFSPLEFLNAYNEVLKNYTRSKVRNAPNSLINEKFWADAVVSKLAYQRGSLFAVHLDREIQRASNGKYSMDDVMRDLLATAKKNPGKRLDADTLRAHIEKRLGRSYAQEIDRYIEHGETVELADDDLGRCFERRDVRLRPYEAGFEVDASITAKKVIGVVPQSAAYQAGLRDDMKLVGWSIYNGDATKEIELNAVEGDKPLKIKFLPIAQTEIEVPQFALKSHLDPSVLKQCDR